MEEYEIVVQNLERLRKNYGLEPNEIDELAKLKVETYQRAILKKQDLTVNELISITKIFMPNVQRVFSSKMRMPFFKDLSPEVKKIASVRLGKSEKKIEKKNFIQYCIIILKSHFELGDNFTNSQIKSYFKGNLKSDFQSKSIEWSKSALSPFIRVADESLPLKTKPEKRYTLVKQIPRDMVEKAINLVGDDWLKVK